MISKRKIFIASAVLLVLLLVVGAVAVLNRFDTSKSSVKIIAYGFSVCTQNVPPSSCGPYEVTVQSSTGTKSVYKVPGFSDDADKREHYGQVSSLIYQAKEKNSNIVLELNSKNEIINAHL